MGWAESTRAAQKGAAWARGWEGLAHARRPAPEAPRTRGQVRPAEPNPAVLGSSSTPAPLTVLGGSFGGGVHSALAAAGAQLDGGQAGVGL